MWWVIWTLLLLLSGVYIAVRLWGLWGQTKELGSELAIAQERIDGVQGQIELLGERIRSPEDLAVFATPGAARIQRDRARAEGRHARRQRRAASSPRRARHVD
jgi:hypothetical protein